MEQTEFLLSLTNTNALSHIAELQAEAQRQGRARTARAGRSRWHGVRALTATIGSVPARLRRGHAKPCVTA